MSVLTPVADYAGSNARVSRLIGERAMKDVLQREDLQARREAVGPMAGDRRQTHTPAPRRDPPRASHSPEAGSGHAPAEHLGQRLRPAGIRQVSGSHHAGIRRIRRIFRSAAA